MKQIIKSILRGFGYEIHKIPVSRNTSENKQLVLAPPQIEPVWPLPRHQGVLSDQEISAAFAKFSRWHYAYQFEGDLSFSSRHNNPGLNTDRPERPIQRFKHFMPYLTESCGGTLRGKRVLDIACNSGFWSIQCALLGAKEVIGFDAREELIEQANLLKSIVGLNNLTFQVVDFWKMSPEILGGKFDVVLNLGILYHLPEPLAVLKLTQSMSREIILLDTAIYPSGDSLVKLKWETPSDIRNASSAGIVAYPSRQSIELMLRHMKFSEWSEIPLRTSDMPKDYLEQKRASWLIRV